MTASRRSALQPSVAHATDRNGTAVLDPAYQTRAHDALEAHARLEALTDATLTARDLDDLLDLIDRDTEGGGPPLADLSQWEYDYLTEQRTRLDAKARVARHGREQMAAVWAADLHLHLPDGANVVGAVKGVLAEQIEGDAVLLDEIMGRIRQATAA